MNRNNLNLSAICGGASKSKPIYNTTTLILELKNNPILQDKILAIMKNNEIMNLVSDPGAINEVVNFLNKVDPDFLITLPSLMKNFTENM
jgi:hypothetical protein